MMNRRTFCLQLVASAACVSSVQAKSVSSVELSSAPANQDNDNYVLWSLLIPTLQGNLRPINGYMIEQTSAVPDAMPSLQTGSPKTPIPRDIEASSNPNLRYETKVPLEFQAAFAEAIAEAKRRQAETIVIERRFNLPKRYRLISQDQVKAYFDLSRSAAPAGWKPDSKVAREYKGWDEVSFISLPYYDRAHKLALIWANSFYGCSSTEWHYFTRSESGWTRQNWNSVAYEYCS